MSKATHFSNKILTTGAVILLTGTSPQVMAHDQVCLSTPLKFKEAVLTGCVMKTELQKALSYAPATGQTGGVTLALRNETKPVTTCQDFLTYRDKGWTPANTFDTAMASFYITYCEPLPLLIKSQPPQSSFISNPSVGLSDLQLLPPTLLPEVSGDDKAAHQKLLKSGATFAGLIKDGKVKILNTTDLSVSFEYGGMKSTLNEIARGDFDGDGLDQILLSESTHSMEGSYGAYGLYIASRGTKEGVFVVERVGK